MSVICTSDIRICEDGSFVYRDPTNNCNFVPCPLSGFTLADLHILCNCVSSLNLCSQTCPVFLTNEVQGQNVTQCRMIEEESCGVNITSNYFIFCEDCRVPPPRPPSIPYPPDMPYNSNPILGSILDPSPSLPPPFLPPTSPLTSPLNPPLYPPSPPPPPIPVEVLPNQNTITVAVISAVSGVIGLIGIIVGCCFESVLTDIFNWRSEVIVDES